MAAKLAETGAALRREASLSAMAAAAAAAATADLLARLSWARLRDVRKPNYLAAHSASQSTFGTLLAAKQATGSAPDSPARASSGPHFLCHKPLAQVLTERCLAGGWSGWPTDWLVGWLAGKTGLQTSGQPGSAGEDFPAPAEFIAWPTGRATGTAAAAN